MIVQKTSIFPASRENVFKRLQKLETLQYIASPYAAFEPVGNAADCWKVGTVSSYRLHLFGIFPFGTHTIRIVCFEAQKISSREGNRHVPVWNHDIFLEPVDGTHTRYTDRVEIGAGWKTLFVWLWAKAFYAHRQRRWIQLLKEEKKDKRVG